MAERDSESAHRKRVGRFYVIVAFFAMCAGDVLLYFYLSLPGNDSPGHSGAIVGSILWTTALFIGIWKRQPWARYVLLAFNCAFIALFSYPLFVSWGRREISLSLPYLLLLGGVLLYIGATALLICSKRVRHLAAKSMIGR